MGGCPSTFRHTGKLLLAFALVSPGGCEQKHPDLVATPPPIVEVARPVERTVTDYEIFTARTEAVQSVELKARVTGYLTRILFKDGEEVKEGDVLFEIDQRPYKAALDQAKATLKYTEAALVEAQAEYEIGLAVQKQAVGAISEQQIVKRRGMRDEASASIDRAKANLETAQLNFDWCKVTAPFAGRTGRHLVDIGGLVTQDATSLVSLVSIRPIWAYFDVDARSAAHYRDLVLKGEVPSARKAEIPVSLGFASLTEFPLTGFTDFVSNQLDPNTGSIRLRAVFPNENGVLDGGMFGRIKVPTSAPHPGLLVVESAVGTNQGERYVLVVDDKDEVEYRVVQVGQAHDGLREVQRFREVTETGPDGKGVSRKVEMLKATDRVIVDGLQRVRPGVKVTPRLVNMVTLLPEAAKADRAAPPAKR